MPYLERDSTTRIFYEVYGEKGRPWITLLNGFSRSSSDFKGMSKHLERSGFRVLTPDNRGAGKTEYSGQFSFDDLMGDIEALWESLSITSTGLLGISYGGVLSMGAALRFSESVDHLILVSTSPTSRLINATVPLDTSDPEAIEKSLLRYFSASFVEKNPILIRSLLKETSRAFLDDTLREKAQHQRTALSRFDFLPDLARITCPVQVVHGTQDEVIPATAAQLTVQHIHGAKLEWFEGAGHLLLAEMPKRLYETVSAFSMS